MVRCPLGTECFVTISHFVDAMSTNPSQQGTGHEDRSEPLLPEHSRTDVPRPGIVHSCFAWLWQHAFYATFLVTLWSVCGVASYLELVDDFDWKSWFTIALVCGALVLMANNCPPELVMLGITLLLRLFGVITEEQAWYGFRSEGILAIGVLFVVAKSLEEAGTIETVVGFFLTNTRNVSLATLKLCLPVVVVSSVVNDTPVVAMMIPVVCKWAMKNGHAASKFLIPLSFSAMLGGMCTLIGTSTNLILQELLERDKSEGFDPGFELNMFTMTPVAAPVAGMAVVYMSLVGMYVLPGNEGEQGASTDAAQLSSTAAGRRIYQMWFAVTAQGAGKTVNDLGVLRVPGARLLEVQRRAEEAGNAAAPREESQDADEIEEAGQSRGRQLPPIVTDTPPAPESGEQGDMSEQRLQAGSMLLFECTADAITKIRKFTGIHAEPKSKLYSELGARRRRRCLVEVVLDRRCPLIGLPVDMADSLSLYNAAIFAVRPRQIQHTDNPFREFLNLSSPAPSRAQSGAPLSPGAHTDPHGDDEEKLKPGDTLLFETYPNFISMYSDSDHFALVRLIEDSAPPRDDQAKDKARKWVAGGIFLCCVVLAATKQLTLLVSMCCGAYLLVAIQCITIDAAFMSIKGRVVLAVIAAFGLGDGLSNTNVTTKIAQGVVATGEQFGPNVLLFLIFLATSCLSCLVSNQTTVIIVYGIVKTLTIPGITMKELVITLIIGASSSFMTPFGYQTNLMVWRSGGYTFANYFRFGLPLTILNGVVATVMCRLLFAD